MKIYIRSFDPTEQSFRNRLQDLFNEIEQDRFNVFQIERMDLE